MKHKELITSKMSDIVNMLNEYSSAHLNVYSLAISRRESIDYLHNQIDVIKNKMEEIQILINNEESLFNY